MFLDREFLLAMKAVDAASKLRLSCPRLGNSFSLRPLTRRITIA